MPARTIASSVSGSREAGPMVATILVRRIVCGTVAGPAPRRAWGGSGVGLVVSRASPPACPAGLVLTPAVSWAKPHACPCGLVHRSVAALSFGLVVAFPFRWDLTSTLRSAYSVRVMAVPDGIAGGT